jgi:hypothetical protein
VASTLLFSTGVGAVAEAHEFPCPDIFVAQARANDIVCRDSALDRIPARGFDAWIELEFRKIKEFETNPDTIVSDETAEKITYRAHSMISMTVACIVWLMQQPTR